MFGAAAMQWLRGLALAALVGAGFAAALSIPPARAELDLSIGLPGVVYYTPPPAFDTAHWYQPVMGGVYLGFGHYHHHYW